MTFLRDSAAIPHARLLPYSHVVPALVRWVRLYGPPSGRVAVLLRRWVWRGVATGLRVGATSVATARKAVTTIDGADPYTSAQRLLSQVDSAPRADIDLGAVHMGHAGARVNLLGLLAAGPRDLVTGEPIPADSVVELTSMTQRIYAKAGGPLAKTFANRIVRTSRVPDTLSALVTSSPDVAASHLVDASAVELLLNNDIENDIQAFLRHRAERVAEQIRRHLADMAEWGARDGQSVSDLLRTG